MERPPRPSAVKVHSSRPAGSRSPCSWQPNCPPAPSIPPERGSTCCGGQPEQEIGNGARTLARGRASAGLLRLEELEAAPRRWATYRTGRWRRGRSTLRAIIAGVSSSGGGAGSQPGAVHVPPLPLPRSVLADHGAGRTVAAPVCRAAPSIWYSDQLALLLDHEDLLGAPCANSRHACWARGGQGIPILAQADPDFGGVPCVRCRGSVRAPAARRSSSLPEGD